MESRTFSGFRHITMTFKIRLVIIGNSVRLRLNREYVKFAKNASRDGKKRKERDKWQ
jgi:hypothetical protein